MSTTSPRRVLLLCLFPRRFVSVASPFCWTSLSRTIKNRISNDGDGRSVMSHRPVILKLPFNISTRIRGDTKGGERAHTGDCGRDYLLGVGASWQRHGHSPVRVCTRWRGKDEAVEGWRDGIGQRKVWWYPGGLIIGGSKLLLGKFLPLVPGFLAADRQSVTSHRYVLPSCHRRLPLFLSLFLSSFRWHLEFDDAIRVIKIFVRRFASFWRFERWLIDDRSSSIDSARTSTFSRMQFIRFYSSNIVIVFSQRVTNACNLIIDNHLTEYHLDFTHYFWLLEEVDLLKTSPVGRIQFKRHSDSEKSLV